MPHPTPNWGRVSLAPTPPQAFAAEPLFAWLVPSGIGESWAGGGASLLRSFSGPWRAGKRPDSGWGDRSSDPVLPAPATWPCALPEPPPLSLKRRALAAQPVRSGCSAVCWQDQQLSGPPCEQPARHSHSPVRPELRMSPAALPSYQGGQACWVWTPEERSCDPLARVGLGARGLGCPCFLSPLAPFLPTVLRVCFGR